MLQIKTIRNILDKAEKFDAEVNAALAEGWTLTKRELVHSHGVLYAELERVEITEEERCCENCAYCDHSGAADPCRSCTEDCDKWEPAV